VRLVLLIPFLNVDPYFLQQQGGVTAHIARVADLLSQYRSLLSISARRDHGARAACC
jgi:hypothetical protein